MERQEGLRRTLRHALHHALLQRCSARTGGEIRGQTLPGAAAVERVMRILEIDTPALLVDLDAMESNLQRMAGFFRDQPTKLRPHFMNHKVPMLARRQMEAGAIGRSEEHTAELQSLRHLVCRLLLERK